MDTGLRRYDGCFNCSLKKSTAIKYPLMAKVNFYLSQYSCLIFPVSYLKKNPPGGGFFECVTLFHAGGNHVAVHTDLVPADIATDF